MNQTELISILNERIKEEFSDLKTAEQVLKLVKESFEIIRQRVQSGERVTIEGFGSFEEVEKPVKKGSEGETKKVIRFKAEKPKKRK